MTIMQKSFTAVSRRRFLAVSASAAGGLAVAFAMPAAAETSTVSAQPWDEVSKGEEVNAWLVIEPDDTVIIRVAKSEMGEGIFTALPMIVAEELGCDWSKVKAEYASANRNVRESNIYQRMGTGGSSSVRRSREYLQQAGASARVRLIQAAATKWNVPPESCSVKDGQVLHAASNQSLGFGALAADAAKITLAAEPAIKTPDQFTLIGKPLARLDTAPKLDGSAKFGIDTRLPDMLYAAIVTCPVFGRSVKSYDDSMIKGKRGIVTVVPIPGGLAVVADRFWRAKEAAAALQVSWTEGPAAQTDSAQFAAEYRAALDGDLAVAKKDGDIAAGLANGKSVELLYEVPHLAHAPMEPLNCTAHVQADRVDVWMGTQDADGALKRAAKTAGMAPEKVYIHNCFLGGGFGRRAINDELEQAVIVSKAVGKPVKLVWTREEDIRHDRYRPQAAIRFQASLAEDGSVNALHAKTAVGSIQRSLGVSDVPSGVEPSAVEGLANLPYKVGAIEVDCILKNTHVPVMFWRSVGSSQNAFAMESFIDELAHAAGQDPYQYRRKLLEGKPDFLAVLDKLAEAGDWGQADAQGQRPRHRHPRILRHHRRRNRRGRGRCQGPVEGRTRGGRGRLRPCDQPADGRHADRERRGLWPVGGLVRRHQHQGWRGGRRQFRSVPGGAHGRHAADRDASGPERRIEMGRHRRARHAADRPGALQRDLRRDRQAHPLAADHEHQSRRHDLTRRILERRRLAVV